MSLKSISMVVVPSLALIAAGGAGIYLARENTPHQAATISRAPPAAAPPPVAGAPPAAGARPEVQAEAAPHQAAPDPEAQAAAVPRHGTPAAANPRQEPAATAADVGALGAALGAPSPDADAPSFDVARIEGTGDAVIAGRAAPGATVDLLCGGTPCDRAVADRAGQFVMVTPRLPAGNYELTLRSSRPDGKQATSARGVMVSLAPRPSEGPAATPSGPAAGSVGRVAAAPEGAGQAVAMARPDRRASTLPIGEPRLDGPTAAMAAPRIASTIVSRGDSLWRISRTTYGDGRQYPLIFKANRKKIRDPDLIFPGQRFVLPDRSR